MDMNYLEFVFIQEMQLLVIIMPLLKILLMENGFYFYDFFFKKLSIFKV